MDVLCDLTRTGRLVYTFMHKAPLQLIGALLGLSAREATLRV